MNTLGHHCEIGLRRKTYNVLTGSVLSVWSDVEQVLTFDGNRKGTSSRMQVMKKATLMFLRPVYFILRRIFQVVRLKLKNGKRIVGTLIPSSAMSSLLKSLSSGSEESEETIY